MGAGRREGKSTIQHSTIQQLKDKKPFYVGSCQPDRLDDNIAPFLASAGVLAPSNNEPGNISEIG